MENDQLIDAAQFLTRIPFLQGSASIERLDKGYCGDDKYVVSSSGGRPPYILRTYRIEEAERKLQEFNSMQLAAQNGVQCSLPIEMGILSELECGYTIITYIEGEEATEAIPRLSLQSQFTIGVQAGEQLRRINAIECPEPMASWYERMLAKHRRYRTEYASCGVSIRETAKLLSYIDNHLARMQGRPNRFQHDDYHIANLIVKDGELSGVIDFNRCDWGDPVHEFVKVGMFSAEVSVPFSIGQMQGYHGNREPDESFWRLYSLYLAMTMISSVVWTLKVVPDEMDAMLARIHRVLDDHDAFERIVPKWYQASNWA